MYTIIPPPCGTVCHCPDCCIRISRAFTKTDIDDIATKQKRTWLHASWRCKPITSKARQCFKMTKGIAVHLARARVDSAVLLLHEVLQEFRSCDWSQRSNRQHQQRSSSMMSLDFHLSPISDDDCCVTATGKKDTSPPGPRLHCTRVWLISEKQPATSTTKQ